MDQNLMVQELSDNELEQVVGGGHRGGHHCKPEPPKCHGHHFHNWCEPKPCYTHPCPPPCEPVCEPHYH